MAELRVIYSGIGFEWFKKKRWIIGLKRFYEPSTGKLVGTHLVFGNPNIPNQG
jgi:hypothetical protein